MHSSSPLENLGRAKFTKYQSGAISNRHATNTAHQPNWPNAAAAHTTTTTTTGQERLDLSCILCIVDFTIGLRESLHSQLPASIVPLQLPGNSNSNNTDSNNNGSKHWLTVLLAQCRFESSLRLHPCSKQCWAIGRGTSERVKARQMRQASRT